MSPNRLQKAETQGFTGSIPGFLGSLSQSEDSGWLPGGPMSLSELFSLAAALDNVLVRRHVREQYHAIGRAMLRRARLHAPHCSSALSKYLHER